IEIKHAGKSGSANSFKYNGNFKITDASPDEDITKLEFYVDGDPGVDSSDMSFSAGYYARIWTVGRITLANNIMELSTPHRTDYNHPAGMAAYVGGAQPYNNIGQLIFRNNVIRDINNASDPSMFDNHFALGIYGSFSLDAGSSGVGNALVEKNLIRLDNVAKGYA